MAEVKAQVRQTIPEQILLCRLQQSEQMREFFIQMWIQNPGLAKQGGAKVQSLLTRLDQVDEMDQASIPSGAGMTKQRGVSLIELIMFIVIISVSLTGILLVMNQVMRHSADPLIHKQAIAAAESLLEEIELQDFISASGVTNPVTQANRASEYHIVNDYNNFPQNNAVGIYPVSGVAPVVGLENYKEKVLIANAALGTIPATGSAVLITVTVTDPQNNPIQISGYRAAY